MESEIKRIHNNDTYFFNIVKLCYSTSVCHCSTRLLLSQIGCAQCKSKAVIIFSLPSFLVFSLFCFLALKQTTLGVFNFAAYFLYGTVFCSSGFQTNELHGNSSLIKNAKRRLLQQYSLLMLIHQAITGVRLLHGLWNFCNFSGKFIYERK